MNQNGRTLTDMTALAKEQSAWEEYLALPDTTLAEFIDGAIYFMASPSRTHQEIISELHLTIGNYLKAKKRPLPRLSGALRRQARTG